MEVQLRPLAQVRLETGFAILADWRHEQLRQRVYRVHDIRQEYLRQNDAQRGPLHLIADTFAQESSKSGHSRYVVDSMISRSGSKLPSSTIRDGQMDAAN